MKWFGRKAGRDAVRPFLFRAWGAVNPAGDWPRSYEAQVREAYLGKAVAQRAVRLVAESVAWAPLLARDGSDGGSEGARPALRLAVAARCGAADRTDRILQGGQMRASGDRPIGEDAAGSEAAALLKNGTG